MNQILLKEFSKTLGWKETAQDQEVGHPGSDPSPGIV